MGGTRYSDADYDIRTTSRAISGTPTFKHDHDIKTGKVASKVHDTLNPFGVKIRESRDSNGQTKVPIMVLLDTTGSMGIVPGVVQANLPKLMGGFLNDKASGKKYLGDTGYPDILISACDDYFAMGPNGALQVGQFESGMEIDDNITNVWITGQGGGNAGESYDLGIYFAARHTAHDHYEKRHRKGYLFILGDEPIFSKVDKNAVEAVIGDKLESDIPIKDIIKEASKRYHIIWGVPHGHEHGYSGQVDGWKNLLGAERVISFDPAKVCEFIVSTVAILESSVGLDELEQDSIAVGELTKALAPLASKSVAKSDLPDLPVPSGPKGKAKRV